MPPETSIDKYAHRPMLAESVVDCSQVDVYRCGGITEFLRIAGVAAGFHLDVSGHCAPHLHAPVAAAVHNLRHLEGSTTTSGSSRGSSTEPRMR